MNALSDTREEDDEEDDCSGEAKLIGVPKTPVKEELEPTAEAYDKELLSL